ncbi:hypothetical protein [Paraburkholderia sp.]|uniref:hypothetical protein n=1 Tax=Paraburkholderia sp. TaxID=1926495 RepID=UPI00239CC7C2|nr:hypothetical protein [Paraburkholderia sp.]MDE1179482.1 hypothetical protein [Paraburkholderia sp.]
MTVQRYGASAAPCDNGIFVLAREYEALERECERLNALINRIPQKPEAVIDFIGAHYNTMGPFTDDGAIDGDVSLVVYSVSVHDILSAFAWSDLDQDAIDAARAKEPR